MCLLYYPDPDYIGPPHVNVTCVCYVTQTRHVGGLAEGNWISPPSCLQAPICQSGYSCFRGHTHPSSRHLHAFAGTPSWPVQRIEHSDFTLDLCRFLENGRPMSRQASDQNRILDSMGFLEGPLTYASLTSRGSSIFRVGSRVPSPRFRV